MPECVVLDSSKPHDFIPSLETSSEWTQMEMLSQSWGSPDPRISFSSPSLLQERCFPGQALNSKQQEEKEQPT